jgi:hypothetical protein
MLSQLRPGKVAYADDFVVCFQYELEAEISPGTGKTIG